MTAPTGGLVQVGILGLPLDVYRRVAEHNDELLREFALIRGDGGDHVPARLLTLIDELNARFSAFTEGPTTLLHNALARGDQVIDLAYEVPADVADAVARLGALLDEADDFCRCGDLLTLATRPEGLAFRRWFLGEFASQAAGGPARPWSTVMEADPEG